MAGLFDSIGTDPVLAARMAEQQRQQQQFQNAVGQFSDPWGKVGAAAGNLLGNITGQVARHYLGGGDSLEMQQAKRQAAVIDALQSADLTTSAGLRAAAKQAHALGDTTTALKLTYQAGQTKLNEAALKYEHAKDARAAEDKAFANMPPEERLSLMAHDPTWIKRANPSMSDEAVAAAQKDAAESLSFKQAVAEAKARDVKSTSATSVTGEKKKSMTSTLHTLGVGGHSFEYGGVLGINDKQAFDDFSSTLADGVWNISDRLRTQRINVGADEITKKVFELGEATGDIVRNGPNDVTHINKGAMAGLLERAFQEFGGTAGQTTPTQDRTTVPAQTGSRRMIPYNPNR